MRPGRHAEVSSESGGIAAPGTRRLAATVGLSALPAHMILAEAGLATQAGVLAQTVAGLALVCLSVQHLTGGLMFELVIFTEEATTETAAVHAPAVIPYT